ncbi:hypothetical protein QE384_002753 [Acinetobacter baylyi]|nr:hypothetical protein [Acinetobacter baylyi]
MISFNKCILKVSSMNTVIDKDYLKFKTYLNDWISEKYEQKNHKGKLVTVFCSYGDSHKRCQVWNTSDLDIHLVKKRLDNFLLKLIENYRKLPEFIKFDFVYNIEQIQWADLKEEIAHQKHNNHYRKGISFDERFSICFLEQEIYAKAIIKGTVYNEPNFIDEKNLQDAIKSKYPKLDRKYDVCKIKKVYIFDTMGIFYENGEFLDLISTGCGNGVRHIKKDKKKVVKELVLKNAEFLYQQILSDGRFVYGYFPAYNREIKSYNTVRHCTALYALLETLEIESNQKYLEKIKISIDYAIKSFYKDVDGKAFMIDGDELNQEIKLGSIAAAIFMLAKYQEITGDKKYQQYSEKLANGILYMLNNKGETVHVLNYPELTVKEKFRIVYYDGEAALGLLRLYALNQDLKLLETVKLMFKNFIEKQYDQYHDHWLSYCTNELTIYCPEEQYFRFGLDNYLNHMEFIRNRKTAYATLLEMMMAAYKMVTRIKQKDLIDLYKQSKFEELKKLIELRVDFQHETGFFYPEIAMYMANPKKILNSFYVRHDRFRTRIDDQEHNLSGYVAYLNFYE